MGDQMQTIDQVEQFHVVYGHAIGETVAIPSEELNLFRGEFMGEELGELITAITEGDLIKFLDGLCDLQYVLDGWFLNAGVKGELKRLLMNEVHRSNMSKLVDTEEEAHQSCIALYEKHQEGCSYRLSPSWNKYVIYRNRDGKVMKGIHFTEPDLQGVLDYYNNIVTGKMPF